MQFLRIQELLDRSFLMKSAKAIRTARSTAGCGEKPHY